MKTLAKSVILMMGVVLNPVSLAAEDEGQFNYMPTDYSIIPPPPEVSALIEHSEISVTYNTGQPNISFTLFSIKSGALELPVVLSYQSGGIRAGQKAGNAGMGWTVLANAAIGRNVVGLPDELSAILDGQKALGIIEQQRRILPEAISDNDFRNFLLSQKTEFNPTSPNRILDAYGDYAQYWRYDYGYVDMANDVSTLSGLGLSATMAYNNGKLLVVSEQPLRVTQKTPYHDAFVVETAAMDRYVFGETEVSRNLHRHGNPLTKQEQDTIMQVSAWYLTSMKNINGDSITFKYKKGAERRWGSASTSKNYSLNPQLESCIPLFSSGGSATYSYPSLLSVINGEGVKAEFYYLEKKDDDLNSNFIIDRIVYSYTGAEKSSIEFRFIYDQDLNLLGINRNDERIYSFDYYEEGNKTNDGFDFGGYRNGLGLSYGGLPSCPYDLYYSGDDRSVMPNYAIIGSLKSIIYPTGGRDVLEWETNTVRTIGGEPISSNPNTSIEQHLLRTDTLCALNARDRRKLVIDNYRVSRSGVYYLNLSEYLQFDPTILYNSDYYSTHTDENSVAGNNYPCVVFRDKSNNAVVQRYYIDDNTLKNHTLDDKYIVVPLSPGLYSIELQNPTSIHLQGFSLSTMFNNAENGGMVYIEERSLQVPALTNDYALWPGLRIRDIFSDFKGSSPGVHKHFFYNNDQAPDRTSGNALSVPEFTHFYYFYMQGKPAAFPDMTSWNFDTYSQVFVTSANGFMTDYCSSPKVEYSDVGVLYTLDDPYQPTDISRDAQWFHYTTARDVGNTDSIIYNNYSQSQPVASRVLTSRAFRRGLLTRHTTAEQSLMTPATLYEYNIYENQSPDLLTTDLFVVSNFTNWTSSSINPNIKHLYSIGKYQIIPYNKSIKSEVYIHNGFRTSTHYNYFYDAYTDNMDRDLVKSRVDTLGDGRVKTTYYTYVRHNRTTLPLKEVEIIVVDGKIIGGEYRIYDDNFHLKAIKLLGAKNHRFAETLITDKSATEELKGFFSLAGYDYLYDDGRLAEIRFNNQVLVSYLWDYENIYPAIEAFGVDYASLKASCSGRPTRNIDNIRSAFPGMTVRAVKWSPLTGPVEISENADVVSRYSYDRQGRLTTVKDVNNALIEQYFYVY